MTENIPHSTDNKMSFQPNQSLQYVLLYLNTTSLYVLHFCTQYDFIYGSLGHQFKIVDISVFKCIERNYYIQLNIDTGILSKCP